MNFTQLSVTLKQFHTLTHDPVYFIFQKQEERSREWEHEMEEQKLKQQKEAIEELEVRRKQMYILSQSNILFW